MTIVADRYSTPSPELEEFKRFKPFTDRYEGRGLSELEDVRPLEFNGPPVLFGILAFDGQGRSVDKWFGSAEERDRWFSENSSYLSQVEFIESDYDAGVLKGGAMKVAYVTDPEKLSEDQGNCDNLKAKKMKGKSAYVTDPEKLSEKQGNDDNLKVRRMSVSDVMASLSDGRPFIAAEDGEELDGKRMGGLVKKWIKDYLGISSSVGELDERNTKIKDEVKLDNFLLTLNGKFVAEPDELGAYYVNLDFRIYPVFSKIPSLNKKSSIQTVFNLRIKDYKIEHSVHDGGYGTGGIVLDF